MTITMENAIKTSKFILTGKNPNAIPGLVGHTGIGKTAIAKQIAKELDWEFIRFNVSQLQEGELAMPFQINDTVNYHLNFKLKEAFDNPDKNYLILFDELNRGASLNVINELMSILDDKLIQNHRIPDNVKFMVAMNPSVDMLEFQNDDQGDDYAVLDLDPAHINRFKLIGVRANVEEWVQYGRQNNIHPYILSYFSDIENHTHFYGKDETGVQMATPRTWEEVSYTLHDMDEAGLDIEDIIIKSAIEGDIGINHTNQFLNYVKIIQNDLMPKNIVKDTPLTENEIETFSKYEGVRQMNILQNTFPVVERKLKEGDELPSATIENIKALWLNIEQKDIQTALTQALFDHYKNTFGLLIRDKDLRSILKDTLDKMQDLIYA